MVSIGQSLNELEKARSGQEAAVTCFREAVLSVAQYVVDIEPELTAAHRQRIRELGESITPALSLGDLTECRASLRVFLRDYRDLTAARLAKLHEELSAKAASLQQLFQAMTQGDGDHERRISATLTSLREMAEDPRSGPIRASLLGAATTLSDSLEELKRQNQLTVAQFLMEIQMLHNRIESLQTMIAVDASTQLASRQQFEADLRTAFDIGAPFSLLLLRARNLASLHRQFDDEVIDALLSAFAKRLRTCIRPEDTAGRWGDDKFAIIFEGNPSIAQAKAKAVSEHCAGTYVCMVDSKPVRPVLRLDIGVVDGRTSDSVERLTQRADEFFGA